jgi:hypothetical protein|tara:strand:+ start:310 stop:1002 length:693 start_codon:yes stop_codon:yes gene_type:complete
MITGIRTITEQFEMAYMVWVQGVGPGSSSYFHPGYSTDGWRSEQWQRVNNKAMFYNESYIDLSGYELEDLTVAPISVLVQDPGIYMSTTSTDVFAMYDIVSMERLSNDDLGSIKTGMTTIQQNAPGMPLGPLDRAQVIYGKFRLFAKNSSITGLSSLMLNARTSRFGSGNATAVSKLWCYRIVVFVETPADGETVTIPASTFVLNVDVVKETELPYMMRLKRSYELATGN